MGSEMCIRDRANKFGGVIFHEACGHLLETTQIERGTTPFSCLLYTSDAADERSSVDLGGRRIIKKG